MKLNQVIPKKDEVFIKRLGSALTFNEFSLDDNVWISETFDSEKAFEEIITDPQNRVQDLLRIAYRVLDIDSKKLIAKYKIEEVSEDTGQVVEIKDISQPEKLGIIVNDLEFTQIYFTLIDIKKRLNEQILELSEKKTQDLMGNNAKGSVGRKSLTQSQVSMDTPSSNSENSQSEKLSYQSRRSKKEKSVK